MILEINLDELKKICIDFFRLAGTGFSLWDENRNNIFSYPEMHGPFCKAIRDNKNLYMKCAKSDKFGLDEVDRTKQPYIYTCHMGLTEAIVPILQDGEIAGYLMMGQIAEEENIIKIENIIKSTKESKDFKHLLSSKLSENTKYSHDKIAYCVNILKVLIEYMNLSYVFKKNNESVFSKVKKHINDNLSSPILPKNICKQIGISQSTLYNEIKKNTGLNPTQYIRSVKITKAKNLLKNTSLSVSDIGEKIGFSDANYFIRIFKNETGISPLKFRKNS